MTKRDLSQFTFGSPQHVIAHATWQAQRGRRPSMSFLGISNPRKALAAAKSCLAQPLELSIKGWWHELRRTELSDLAKEILTQAIRAFRKGDECPETTSTQFVEIMVQGVGSLKLNGTHLGMTMQGGRLMLEPIS